MCRQPVKAAVTKVGKLKLSIEHDSMTRDLEKDHHIVVPL